MTKDEKIKALLSGDINFMRKAIGLKPKRQKIYYAVVGDAILIKEDGSSETDYEGSIWDENGVKHRYMDVYKKAGKYSPFFLVQAMGSEEEILQEVAKNRARI